MANTINIGNATSLIIKIPARGETNWSQEFKEYFADVIADHDHTSGQGARIKNSALVTYTMVNDGAVFKDVNNNEVAYVETDVTVSTDTIQNSAVTTVKIADDAVTGDKIADNSITTDHIAPDTVIAADIATNAITEDELRDDASDDSLRAVSTNHIKDANVTTAKIADANITTSKIADANVTTAKIADSSVTVAKIADYNVTTAKLNGEAVTTEKIADANVTAAKIGSDVVLSTLNNVSSTTPSTNDTLEWSGTEWTPTTRVVTVSTNTTISNDISDTTFVLTTGSLTIEATVKRCRVISDNSNASLKISSNGIFTNNYVNITGNLDLSDWDPESGSASEFSHNHGQIGQLSGDQDGVINDPVTSSDTKSNGIFSYNNLIITNINTSGIHVALGTISHNKLIFNQPSNNQWFYAESISSLGTWYSELEDSNYFKFLEGGRVNDGGGSGILGDSSTPWILSNNTVSRLNPPISLTAPTTGQILKWDGSEWGPDNSGETTDVISSSSEAASYSGTSRIIYITANEHVTFTANLKNKVVFQSVYGKNVTFQGNVESCIIHCEGNIILENTSTDGSTDSIFEDNTAKCYNFTLNNSGNTSGNTINIDGNTLHVKNIFKATENVNQGYEFLNNKVMAEIFEGGGSTQKLQPKGCSIECDTVRGKIDIPSGFGSVITAFKGSVLGSTQIDIAGTTYLSGIYNFPIEVSASGINTKIVVKAYPNVTSQPINTADPTKITLAGTHVDNTSSFDTATNYRFTAKVKGEYLVMPKVFFSNINTDVVFEVRTNGASVNADNIYSSYVDSSSRVVNGAIIVELNVGDYLEFYSDAASDSSYSINNALTIVSIKKIN